MNKICVISQPTFLPWLGWFDLVDQADVMVILDDVSFSKQSWQQRNRIRTRQGLEYLSVPVKTSGRMGQSIMQCELAEQPFVDKMLRTLQGNYAKAPYFSEMFDELSQVFRTAAATGLLLEVNCALITWLASRLEITTPMVRASTLDVGGQRGEHVAAICEHIGTTDYLSPVGSADYLVEDRAAFDRRGINVWLHNYEHPVYTQQFEPFMPYACALDLVFNEGTRALAVIRSGRRPSAPLQNLVNHVS